MNRFLNSLARRKHLELEKISETNLARCLTTLDLTALGVGSTLGAGIYVVAGQVALETAGPSVILSFLIAAIASILAGLCYAEFGARVPRTGSAYVYSYVTVGEFIGFVIGWNLILEYVIGTSSVARAWSQYFDSLIDKAIQNFFKEHMPMDVGGLSEYPDFFAFGITLLLTVVLAIGVRESSTFNNIFTALNLLVVLYVTICGLFKADVGNWKLSQEQVGSGNGKGGFFPFGVSGMLSGAATCFYAFVGFDCIATTGEECKNPKKSIPISIIFSLLLVFIAYFSVSSIITLMVPYYILDKDAPLSDAFGQVGWNVAEKVIAVGAICGLSTSLLGAMFPLPRVIYAMASDGVVFRFLANINERLKTPLLATILSGIFAGAMACLFDLTELVNMMSIGTLLAYALVAVCVLILRYQTDQKLSFRRITPAEIQRMKDQEEPRSILALAIQPEYEVPTRRSELIVIWAVGFMCLSIVCFCSVIVFAEDDLTQWWSILLACIFGLMVIAPVVVICRQPQNDQELSFKVPLIPFLPAISIFINTYLMLKLPVATWIRFGVWMFIGFLIYFGYGIRNSNEAMHQREFEHMVITEDVIPTEYGDIMPSETTSLIGPAEQGHSINRDCKSSS